MAASCRFLSSKYERYKGYPDGIKGKDIRLGARILAVADVFDALESDRPYRQGMDLERAIGIIKENSGSQFDPEIVKIFLQVIKVDTEGNEKKDRGHQVLNG